MAVEFLITSGARTGARERFDKSVVSIGRHPTNDLRFDAERDLEVSSRHAELRAEAHRVVLVDLGSTNGTFVNGDRVSGERVLNDGDVVTFGAGGPQAEFRTGAELAAPATRLSIPSAPQVDAPRKQARPSTDVRIAMAVEKQTGSLKRMVMVLAAVVVLGAVGAAWVTRRNAEDTKQQLAALLAANDSLSRSTIAAIFSR